MNINIRRAFNRTVLQLKKHSPEILVGAGCVGVVASAVMACKATLKVNEILEETKKEVNNVHQVLSDETISTEVYSEEDSKKDLAVIYTKTGLKLVKLYAPAVGLGVLSIASILSSNHIMRKRNVALMAAYTAVDTGFKEYRGRVIERFGEQLDHELKFNVKAEEIEETIINENGEEETVKKIVETPEIGGESVYARFFDAGNKGWEDDPEYNLMYIKQVQTYLNEKLRANGHVFLNEAYDEFGIPRTRAGAVVGWIYDPKNPKHNGDNYIDFGVYDIHNENKRRFVNGYEKVIVLDFNVDGVIYDKI